MILIASLGYYFLVGLLFAIWFFFKGYSSLLAEAVGTSKRVRLLWMPAAAAIWPILLFKWQRQEKAH